MVKKATTKKATTKKATKKKVTRKKKLPIISRVRLEGFIRQLKGKIFTVEFIKKDDTKRVMNARLGVTAFVKGTGKPNGKGTSSIKVYDMQKQAYRQINLETVTSIRAEGKSYEVK